MSRPIPKGVEPPDKDALIRELVSAIQGFQKLLEDGPENASFPQCEDALVAAADTLTLARTTCPEAFDGCYETPADGR